MNKSLAEELQVEVVDDTPETDKPFVKEEKKEEKLKRLLKKTNSKGIVRKYRNASRR